MVTLTKSHPTEDETLASATRGGQWGPTAWAWSGYGEWMGSRKRNRLLDVKKLLWLLRCGTGEEFRESHLRAVRPFLLCDANEAAFFLNHAGRRMPYHTFRRIVGQYAAKAGLPVNVSAHTFRRSCTTELIRGGANLYHVKELLGHESLDTLQHYAKLNIQDLKETHRKCHPRERGED